MEKRENRGLIGTIFCGLSMGWGRVLLLAVAAAALTAVFLILPVFRNSSFERMGVYLEAWIFFAVLIMSNCKKPLESAGKTFVFFLISQPLIYLFQVPFSALGWGLFQFYRYWFILTLLTFPGAFLGWYVTKRNWWSVLILAPVLAYLGIVAWDCGQSCLRQFPGLLVTVLFCLLQIGLYQRSRGERGLRAVSARGSDPDGSCRGGTGRRGFPGNDREDRGGQHGAYQGPELWRDGFHHPGRGNGVPLRPQGL